MSGKQIDWVSLYEDLSVNKAAPKGIDTIKLDTGRCPVCGLNRNKGNHQKCSRITQLKHRKERG
jgi:hypothetical protein